MRFPLRGFAAGATLALALASCSDAELPTAAAPAAESPILSLSAATAPSELFISEYIEGSSFNKAIEIYNGTGAAVDLGALGYRLEFYSNGSASAGLTIALTGAVATGDVYVVAQSSATAAVLAEADQVSTSTSWYNGDDAVVLRRGSAIVDVLGQVGFRPSSQWGSGLTSTADNTLRRKPSVCAGDTDGADAFDPTVEWIGYANDTFNGLGAHEITACDDDGGAGGGGGGGGGNEGGTKITPTGSLLSEVRVEQSGAEIDEYIEFAAAAGTSLDGLTYVVVGRDAAGGNGVVASVIPIAGTVPSRGFFVVAEETLTLGVADLTVAELGFDNSNNRTHFLVRGWNGAVGTDLDADDDGTLDALPWSEVVDCLSFFGPAGNYKLYCSNAAGPDNNFVPGHMYRENNVWKVGNFAAGTNDTPGRAPGTSAGVLTFVGRSPSEDPALPVGFQAQLFARKDNASAVATWESLTPAIASIDQLGVITGLAAGSARFRATTADGTTGVITLPVAVAQRSALVYEGNTEFGIPTDGDAADDRVIVRDQLTASYNPVRNTPNWVSYNLDGEHFGSFDRCNCFTLDPELADLPTITTADYTSSGYSRGHLVRSADRDAGALDNAYTYLFSNIVPQQADNNEGPWAALETHLGTQAATREVYIIAGVAGSQGTLKNEGKITIPGFVWKVAVLLPRDQGLDDVDSADDFELISVMMPNVSGIRNTAWTDAAFAVTVDQIEAATGYDLLALLPDRIERLVERGGANTAPTAAIGGETTTTEGGSVTLTAAGSADADGDALTFLWALPDGTTHDAPNLVVSLPQDGSVVVRLTVADEFGATATTTATVTASNVAPEIGAFAGATLFPGESYRASGIFSDPGADAWTATVDYGTGAGPQPLALDGKGFALEHPYTAAGTYTVTVTVSDDDQTVTRTATVTVTAPMAGMQQTQATVQSWVAGGVLTKGEANVLDVKMDVGIKQLEKGHVGPATNQLDAFVVNLDELTTRGRLTTAQAAPVRDQVLRIRRSINR